MPSTPSRFPFGVNNVAKPSLLGNYLGLNPFAVHEYANDFDTYAPADWTVTGVGASSALQGANGGYLLQTSAGTGTDIQFNLKTPNNMAFVQGQQVWFMWDGILGALTSVLGVGLQFGGTAFAPTDGVYFRKQAASSPNIDFIMRSGGVQTLMPAVTTIAAISRITLGFYFDGRADPTLYIYSSTPVPALVAQGQPYWNGGVCVASAGAQSPSGVTLANLPTVNLAPGFGFQETAAGAQTLQTDYVFVANEILRF
jgi:hypothetical protein